MSGIKTKAKVISMNLVGEKISPDDLKKVLGFTPVERSLMVWGPPGVGKSEAVAQYCKETGKKLYDVRLPLLDPIDLRGIGIPNTTDGTCVWLPPEFIPREPNSVLFLDEITAAPPTLQAAAYQLTLDRRIGEVELPSDCRVIAAGNRETDRAVSYRMPSPLANRLVHLEVEASFASWRMWAVRNHIDPMIVSYLTIRPEHMYQLDANTSGGAWASPRSWSFVDQYMSRENITPEILGLAISGCVGRAIARDFIQFSSQYHSYSDSILKILNGKQKTKITESSRAQVFATAVVINAEEKHIPNVGEWALCQNAEWMNLTFRLMEERFGMGLIENEPSYKKYLDPLRKGFTSMQPGVNPKAATGVGANPPF